MCHSKQGKEYSHTAQCVYTLCKLARGKPLEPPNKIKWFIKYFFEPFTVYLQFLFSRRFCVFTNLSHEKSECLGCDVQNRYIFTQYLFCTPTRTAGKTEQHTPYPRGVTTLNLWEYRTVGCSFTARHFFKFFAFFRWKPPFCAVISFYRLFYRLGLAERRAERGKHKSWLTTPERTNAPQIAFWSVLELYHKKHIKARYMCNVLS